MKRFAMLALAGMMVVLTACGEHADKKADAPAAEAAAPAAEAAAPAAEEAAPAAEEAAAPAPEAAPAE